MTTKRMTHRVKAKRSARRGELGIVEELGLLARGDLTKVKGRRGTFTFMYTRNGEATLYGPVDPRSGKPRPNRRAQTITVLNEKVKGQ